MERSGRRSFSMWPAIPLLLCLFACLAILLFVLIVSSAEVVTGATTPQNADVDALARQADRLMQAEDYKNALPLLTAIVDKVRGDPQRGPTLTTALYSLGIAYKELDRPADAVAALTELIPLVRALYGETDRRYALAMFEKVQDELILGDFASAYELLPAALAAVKANFSTEQFAAANFKLAEVMEHVGELQEAAERLRAILPISGPYVTSTQTKLGGILDQLGDFAGARHAFQKATDELKAAQPKNTPLIANALLDLAIATDGTGDGANADRLFDEAIRLIGSVPEHYGHAASLLMGRAEQEADRGHYRAAKRVYERGIAFIERDPGLNNDALADALVEAGQFYANYADFADAETSDRRALALREKAYGEASPQIVSSLTALGFVEMKKGQSFLGRKFMERAIAIQEKDPNLKANLGNALFEFGGALVTQWDYEAAEPVLIRARSLLQAAGGNYRNQLANCLKLLALDTRQLGDKKTARAYEEEAISVEEKTEGVTLTSYVDRAHLFDEDKDYDQAKAMFKAILELYTTRNGSQQSIAGTQDSLASVLEKQHEYKDAKLLRGEALKNRIGALGADHPNVAGSYYNLGHVNYFLNDAVSARADFLKAAELFDTVMSKGIPNLSIAEQRAYLDAQVRSNMIGLLVTHRSADDLEKAYDLLFRWKGIVPELLRHETQFARAAAANPAILNQTSRLSDLRLELANWYTRFGKASPEMWKSRNAALTAQKEAIERSLSQSLPGSVDVLQRKHLSDFRQLLGDNEIFVDIYRHSTLEPGGPDRYDAILSLERLPYRSSISGRHLRCAILWRTGFPASWTEGTPSRLGPTWQP